MSKSFFPENSVASPKIYAYSDSHPQYEGLLKVGYTVQSVEERVAQQFPIRTPGEPTYKIVLDISAIRNDGSSFTDKHVHKYLKSKGFLNPDGEWFKCSVDDVRGAVNVLSSGDLSVEGRPNNFAMRPEQK